MRGLDQDLWDNMGGFDVDILKKTRKFVYKIKQSKNTKEKKDMTEAQIKQKKASKEEADKKLFKHAPIHTQIVPLSIDFTEWLLFKSVCTSTGSKHCCRNCRACLSWHCYV